jgi:hypothetical protein
VAPLKALECRYGEGKQESNAVSERQPRDSEPSGEQGMSDAQLYLAIGLPSFVALVGILVNVGYFVALNGRMTRVEDKLDVLTGKVADVNNRVVRIEDKLGIVPR